MRETLIAIVVVILTGLCGLTFACLTGVLRSRLPITLHTPFAAHQGFEEVVNLSSWDVYFYTRNHNSIETDRSRRHVTRLLTFPVTVAGAIHQNSPYTRRSMRLTHEGLRSMVGE